MRAITVVGASLAGLSAARALRAQSYDGRIVVIGDEPHQPYDRPPLSKDFLAGKATVEDIALSTPDDAALDVDWRLGHKAVGLDAARRAVRLDSGEELVSDGVVLATGARARTLPGSALTGVHTLRSLDDALALRAELAEGGPLVVIGAGFIGAEVASTARSLGLDVTVVEALPTPLAGPLGPEMGALVAALHLDHGTRLVTGVGVAGFVGEERVRAVRLADGRELPAAAVVVGVGATPNVDWLAGSGVGVDGGVLTDARCVTEVPGIVAVGDCALSYNRFAGAVLRLEHWTNAVQQPEIAAATLLGRRVEVRSAAPYFWSDQYGVRLQFAGHRRPGDVVGIVEGDPADRSFAAVYRRGGHPVAVLAVNQPKLFGRLRRELAVPEPEVVR
ncbi:FAD-dependent oxidoreductase [Saccharothrix sp. ALI-22-I]|uniref:NAD(P)/FAD-dependent oxidoreductase n=1 Tax=Saccharothrix sp. ALI-22-I TaxID=1933778 RepID=UPI00097C57A5|nr:FAD/NAD(P)-binding oxidoreductase [Saccharothrix sp. ALI-22-I]ONI88883.1 FAD-dependent oxidoreductase [Saccharothrix sp. ALI-22-I]